MVAVIEQGGDQPVAVADPAPVGADNGQFGVDDAYGQPVEVGQEGPVGEVGEHRWPARTPRQEPGAGAVELIEECGGVEGPVEQHDHARAQQRQQPPGQGGLVSVGR